jgi:glycosyltransferase involved in cell wall biosynthesis
MRILFVMNSVPHPDADNGGGKMFAYCIQKMIDRGHQVSLLTLTKKIDLQHVYYWQPRCDVVIPVCAGPSLVRRFKRIIWTLVQPVEYAFCESVKVAKAVQTLICEQHFDIIHAVHPWLIHAVLQAVAPIVASSRPRVIGHVTDVWSKLALRDVLRLQGLHRLGAMYRYALMSAREFSDYALVDGILISSVSDEEFVRSVTPKNIPLFQSPIWFDAITDMLPSVDSRPRNSKLLYVGNSADPRTRVSLEWFLREVFPLILDKVPETVLNIVSVRADHMRYWSSYPNVVCHSYTPDLLPFYDQNAVLVAPLLVSGGQHLKIANAFARGCPVVMTPAANDGIHALHKRDALIASSPNQFAASVVELLNNHVLALDIAQNALSKIRSNYPFDVIPNTIEFAYQSCLNNPKE